MRKILLASTALVAVAGISAASAEISLSGGTDVSYTTVSDDQQITPQPVKTETQ